MAICLFWLLLPLMVKVAVRWNSFGLVEFYHRLCSQNLSRKLARAIAKSFTIYYKHTSSFMYSGCVLGRASWKQRQRWRVIYKSLIEGFRDGQWASERGRDRTETKYKSAFSWFSGLWKRVEGLNCKVIPTWDQGVRVMIVLQWDTGCGFHSGWV